MTSSTSTRSTSSSEPPVEELVHPAEREAVSDVIGTVEVEADVEAVTCEDRTLVRSDGEAVRTTVQWRAVNHWGRRHCSR